MIQFSIGLSALQAAQQGLAIAGNNLANASTPGYHRQVANLATLNSVLSGGKSLGTGVQLADINRAVSDQLDAALNQQLGLNEYVNSSLLSSTQIEQTISDGSTSPSSLVERLLNQLRALSSNPTNGAALQSSVAGAGSVASAFNLAISDLDQIQSGLDQSISGTVGQINSYSKQIADLNVQIAGFQLKGVSPNDLLDQRGQLVSELSKLANVTIQNGDNGQLGVYTSGISLVSGSQSIQLKSTTDSTGVKITAVGTDDGLTINGGQLGGLLSQRNGTLADFRGRLNTLARQVITSFNTVQSTGLSGKGGFTSLTSTNSVSSTTANLNAAGLNFPPNGGSLYIGVTNVSTGQRTITQIPVNPVNQSLQGLASSIGSSIPQLQAFVSTQTGTLSVNAAPGYTFDFAGGFEGQPQTTFSAGTTTVPQFGGNFTGTNNDNYKVKFLSSGSVGITSGLQAEVTNQAGAVVATVNIGQGYQAGQPITLANGLTVTLAAGNVVTGDSFATPVVGNPDSASILNALGLNTLFSGSDAASISLNSGIASDPSRLSTSRTGQPGDTTNLQRFAALSDSNLLGNGTQTFSQYSHQMVSDIGIEVQTLTQQQSTNQTLTTSITNQQQSVSGVDTNEELAKVLQYQQMFATAGKYISTVNETLSQLLQII